MYYHIYSTCPNCHEPHVNGSPLQVNKNGILKCMSCGTYFKHEINFNSSKYSEKFKRTAQVITEWEGNRVSSFLSHFPIVWKVIPNQIEKEYISWVSDCPPGKFLVTWPWREVKFIPILVTEYLLENPDRKAAVIGEIADNSPDKSMVPPPDIKIAFDNLIYLEEVKTEVPEPVRKEMNKFDRRIVIEKKKFVNYSIHRIGTHYFSQNVCGDTFIKCRNRLKKEVEEIYGENCIKKIDEIRLKNGKRVRDEKLINPDGDIDIKLVQQREYTGDLHYDRRWLWEVMLNSKKIRRVNRIIPNSVMNGTSDSDLHMTGDRLYWISSENDPDAIFRFVDNISPDLLIIQNVDNFIRDKIYDGKRSRALLNFLSNNRNCCILMFSSDPDTRHLYEVNEERGLTNKYNILPHTWDTDPVIKKLKEKNLTQSRYPNSLSSRWNEIPDAGEFPDIEYIEVKSLDKLDAFFDEIISYMKDEIIVGDIKKYFRHLKRSPLYLKGDYEKPEIFKRMGKSIKKITYDNIMSMLYEKVNDMKKLEDLEKGIRSLYTGESGEETNPLMKATSQKLHSILESKDSYVTIVVHPQDVRGTKKILTDMGFGDYMPSILSVCSWSDMHQNEGSIPSNARHFIISTLPPYLNYSIYFSPISEIIFIGGSKNIEKIKTIIKNRLMEIFSRPLYLLSQNDSAPKFLKTLLKDITAISNEDIENISRELIIEFKSITTQKEDISTEYGERDSHHWLKSGENVILVVDKNGRGMFIPSGVSLTIKDNQELDEIYIDTISESNLEKKLRHKKILIDAGGVYRSFRSIFIKKMLMYGNKIVFRRGPYEWKSFQDLFKSAIHWIIVLKVALREFSVKTNRSKEKVESEFSEYLASLDITAENPDYIKGWWSNYENVEIGDKKIPLYRVEHPKGLSDLKKIYEGINAVLPGMKLKIEEAERSYMAAILIQNIRRSVLKGRLSNPSLYQLHMQLKREIKEIVENSPVFEVSAAYLVKLVEDVEPFQVMNEYKKYITTSE